MKPINERVKRPMSISEEEMEENWNAIFKREKKNKRVMKPKKRPKNDDD